MIGQLRCHRSPKKLPGVTIMEKICCLTSDSIRQQRLSRVSRKLFARDVFTLRRILQTIVAQTRARMGNALTLGPTLSVPARVVGKA